MPKKVDWSYHRRGWKTCTKTQEFLANAGIETKTEIDAKKETHQKNDAIGVLKKASKLVSARGKKIVEVDLKKTDLTEEEVLKLILGPTGNLRAPTLMVGKKMIVGFNEEMYDSVFG